MKKWRKLIWGTSKVMLQLRLSELEYVGLERGKAYYFKVIPDPSKKSVTIEFKGEDEI